MSGQTPLITDMPRKSWAGMTTISDEVLERIICTSHGKETKGFPAKEVRIHLKNYFDHMCLNINGVTSAIRNGQQWQANAQLYLVQGKYIEAANGVLAMLETIKMRLEDNSTSWVPK